MLPRSLQDDSPPGGSGGRRRGGTRYSALQQQDDDGHESGGSDAQLSQPLSRNGSPTPVRRGSPPPSRRNSSPPPSTPPRPMRNPLAVPAADDALNIPVVLHSISADSGPVWWLWYVAERLWEPFRVVGAIAAYLLFCSIVLLQHPVPDDVKPLPLGAGFICTVFGLALFLEGLRFGVMPLGEAVGTMLPQKASLAVTLLVALVLGVGVTFAEPAVGALEAVGKSVDGLRTPYLWYLLNHWNPGLIAAVGTGVGAAAVIGVLRFLRGWPFKRPLWWALSATLLVTFAFAVLQPEGADGIIALAWDCGAVTTGPVTVPIVLALGVGVVAASGQVTTPLASFGLVTLASLLPVIFVTLLAVLLIAVKPVSDIVELVMDEQDAPADIAGISSAKAHPHLGQHQHLGSPLAETVSACRALLPLVTFLSLVLVLGLKQRLPTIVLTEQPGHPPVRAVSVWPGLVAALLGLVIFNIGLTHGLAPLGQFAGAALPAAFSKVDGVRPSPLLPKALGVACVLIFLFILGIGATMAEPALAALGLTVARLTNGRFPKQVVQVAVPVGVALGLVSGAVKLLDGINVAYLVLPLYPAAALLTYPNEDDLAAIAWDSAGVTTGPVTVPLVLALGSGLARVAHAEHGFGLLTMASICPITVVLLYGLYRQRCLPPAPAAAVETCEQESGESLAELDGPARAVDMVLAEAQHEVVSSTGGTPRQLPQNGSAPRAQNGSQDGGSRRGSSTADPAVGAALLLPADRRSSQGVEIV
eukprot:TRINITY_DN50927_c0_g1_i1.p1 TRINITY_DN50927_c0_g1~~TRINITY_DN50927_c0_g1_i1.p1  ORF type:complete len:787 (+),score=181.44 TRINITY_DN50927_c0_g1_i1:89-2362(+)